MRSVRPRWAARAGAVLVVLLMTAEPSLPQTAYRRPPRPVTDVLGAPPLPQVSVSPTGAHLLLIDSDRHPPIAELAEPMLRLAGLRINPDTFGPARAPRFRGLTLVELPGGRKRPVSGLPEEPAIGNLRWSPDGARFAFTNTTESGIDLWVAEVDDAAARLVAAGVVNDTVAPAVRWMPDGQTLLVARRAEPGPAPEPPKVPAGPVVQESSGRSGPVRTYQDLLKNPHDEALFDHYATAQMTLIDPRPDRHAAVPVGGPGIYSAFDPSPDGKYFLVERVKRPYSYLHTYRSFPLGVEVWDRDGRLAHKLADVPLADRVPIDGVRTGPRAYRWDPTESATLVWVEALDEGDPEKKVPFRDRVMTLSAPFGGEPKELARTEHRFAGLVWGETGDVALLTDYDRDRKWARTVVLFPGEPGRAPEVLFDRSVQDSYGNPGTPELKALPHGGRVLRQRGDAIYLSGPGATPQGDRPFLDRLDLKTRRKERLFHCGESVYETVVEVLDDDATRLLIRRESPAQPPNYFLRSSDGSEVALTDYPDPAPLLRKVRKQIVTYRRKDGVALSFTLYLPPDYEEGQRRPAVFWAYPVEYASGATAGQVRGSPNRFTLPGGPSHLFFLLQGYVVVDEVAMPVVGPPESANDTFVEQLVMNAEAAVDKAAELGVIDRERIGIGGHSYGAFMTANLLAHTDLFRAGIGRSGAYNRTLTPFGFQNERRTFWEAPEVYGKMSPFYHAHKIDEPLLLIHGAADNNSGTFPIQSERLYQAIRGNGGTARLVVLPHESHGYVARESVEHALYEMFAWFDRHVKNAKPREPKKEAGE